MYYVYILKNKIANKFYTGATSNLKERLKDHGWHTVKTTKTGDYKLVWFSVFLKKQSAYNFERYLKTGSGIAFRNKHLI